VLQRAQSAGQGRDRAGGGPYAQGERLPLRRGRRPGRVGPGHLGALYSNFADKEAVLEEVVATQLGIEFASLAGQEPSERRRIPGEKVRLYLSDPHRNDPGHGCVIPSPSADVARAGDSVREAYRRRMAEVVALPAPAMRGTQEEQEQRARTLLASIVVAVTIARALPSGDQAQAVLDAALASALGKHPVPAREGGATPDGPGRGMLPSSWHARRQHCPNSRQRVPGSGQQHQLGHRHRRRTGHRPPDLTHHRPAEQ
jgi:TetR/AcrR family transcriptional repressor of nem operon